MDGGGAAALVDVHELADEGLGIEADAFGEKADESATVDWRGDAVEVLVLDIVDDLHEDARLCGDLGLGEALGFAGLAEGLTE